MGSGKDTARVEWISAERLLADDAPLEISRDVWTPAHDSASRSFLHGLLELATPGSVACQVSRAPDRVCVVRVSFRADDLSWDDRRLESAAPFFAVHGAEGAVEKRVEPGTWLLQWTTPRFQRTPNWAKSRLIWRAIEAWGEEHPWTPDEQGPFVTASDFFDGNEGAGPLSFPAWPRRLTYGQIRDAVHSLASVPGVDECYVEILSGPAGVKDAWPSAADLVVAGPVSTDELITAAEGVRLLGAAKRIGPIESVVCLSCDGGPAKHVGVNHAIWLSEQLSPVWMRACAW